jgi:hypothetical protein
MRCSIILLRLYMVLYTSIRCRETHWVLRMAIVCASHWQQLKLLTVHWSPVVLRMRLRAYPRGFLTRSLSSISTLNAQFSSSNTPSKAQPLDPRWLTLIKRRIGKCLMFGLKPTQVEEAGQILRQIARDWRELIAGSEGFLTGKTRRALFRHSLAWGEMVLTSFIQSWESPLEVR